MRISIKELIAENEPRELEAILFGRRAAMPEEAQGNKPQGIAKMDAPVVVGDEADIKRIADGLAKHMEHRATTAGGAVSGSDTGKKPENDRVTISRRDLYCIARLLKSANYALIEADKGGLFDDCEKCKFQCETENNQKSNYNEVCEILTRETGITLFAPHDWPEKWPPRGAMA